MITAIPIPASAIVAGSGTTAAALEMAVALGSTLATKPVLPVAAFQTDCSFPFSNYRSHRKP